MRDAELRVQRFEETLRQIVKDAESLHDGNGRFLARLFADMAQTALDEQQQTESA